ncbi:MAG: protein kinase [Planctomycetes bacterium]|nr:protein kinase [Planctomycetota bacterium]
MAEDRQKSIVAALLAVRSGIVTPDQAVAALKDPGKASSLVQFGDQLPLVTLSGDDGEFLQLPIIDILEDPAKQKRALEDLGISETVQQTLFNFGSDGETEYRVLRDTFKQVAGGGRRLGESDIRPAVETEADSESPTQAPQGDTGVLRLTTGKFFPNFGVANERYEIRREHARGGMGRIMLARDRAIGRDIALKELLPGMQGGNSIPGSVPQQYTNDSGGIIERFLREAKITGQLEHPNIVPVYEIGKHGDGSIYYTMRFVRGKTLSDRLREIRKDDSLNKQEKLAARTKLLDSFIDVCQAIAYAHSKGVIHRDLKPENIMLGDFGETQVLDWGLARIKGQEDKALKDLQKGSLALSKSLIQSDSQALTLDGSIVGTPAYMPPEQARGELENVDEQSDVYSLGAVLYQILTGLPPYEGPMAALIVQAVLSGPPLRVSAREKDIPPELEALVEKAMARDKKDRIRSALELASEVKAFRDGRTLGSYQYSLGEMVRRYMRQHRTAVSLGVLCFLLLVAATIFFLQRLTEQRDAAETARKQAESQQKIAQDAYAAAEFQRKAREKAEQDARDAAQAELESRVDEARRMMETIDGMRIEPALDDLSARVSEYEMRLAGPPARSFLELPVDEQVSNGVLLSSLLGYVSAKQNLIDLLTGPAGTRLPDAVAQIDLESERKDLDQIRLQTARLAAINGDFPLALLLLSGAGIAPDLLAAEKARVETSRADLLALHRTRISEALADVEAGLGREFREPDAPGLDEYVKRLSSYRERQTVELLKTELESLASREVSSWGRPRFDLAILVCRVLGNCNQPSEAVPVLAAFLDNATHPELVFEASRALCASGSTDAFPVLTTAMRRRGLDYWRAIEPHFASLPMPARVREPQVVADWIDRSVALRARRDYPGAEQAAARALLLDEKSAEALLHRALAHRGNDRPGAAEADLNRALELEPQFYEALLERGRLRNDGPVFTPVLDDFTQAIDLRPGDWRGWRARGDACGRRYKLAEAVADYERALQLEPNRLELYLEYAERLGSNGRYQEAHTQLTRAVERWPEDWRTWSARAWLRREAGLGDAQSDAQRAVALNPLDAKSWDVASQIYFAHSRFMEGIDAATKAVEADPEEWLAWYYRGLHWHKWAEKEDAGWFNTAGGGGGARPRALDGQPSMSRSELLRVRREKRENAANDFREALKVEPEDFRSWFLLADTLIQLQRYDEAAEACRDALARSPFCYMRWGGTAVSDVRFWNDALAYRHLLKSEPRDNRERIGKAMMLAVSGGSSVFLIEDERQKTELAESLRLLLQVGDDPLLGDDLVFYCYASDRLLDALMGGGGRFFYFEAVQLCEQRVKLGRFLDADFHTRHALALAGVAAMYKQVKLTQLIETPERQAEFESMNLGLLADREQDYRERAGKALLAGAEVGLRFADGLDVRGAPWPVVTELPNWSEIESALSAPAAAGGESLYDRLILLVAVTDGSPAWQAGLRKFDNILSVNGTAVNSTDDFMQAWRPIPEGQEVVITARRFVLKDGNPRPVLGADGKPVVDQQGFVTWQAEEFEVKVKRGFLGINLGQGFVPPRFAR